ncbi:hypothetical protein D9M70_435340 [compost metagenome]
MRRGRKQHRVGKRVADAGRQHLVAVGAAIVRLGAVGKEALAGERLVHQAHHRVAIAIEADQRAPDRQAGNEGARAVDRVDDPHIFAVEPDIAMLFAKDAMLRKMLLDQRTDRSFRRLVRLRYRIEAAFDLVDHAGADPESRQGLCLGSFSKAIEEGAVRQHGSLSGKHGRRKVRPA